MHVLIEVCSAHFRTSVVSHSGQLQMKAKIASSHGTRIMESSSEKSKCSERHTNHDLELGRCVWSCCINRCPHPAEAPSSCAEERLFATLVPI